METTRTYRQQLSDLLRRKEHRGWSGQITYRGIMDHRAEVVAELFAPGSERADATYTLSEGS